MKINGDLEVLGKTTIKISDLDNYIFDAADIGQLILDSGKLKYNNGTKAVEVSTTEFMSVIAKSLGSWVMADLSLNPIPLNDLDNVSDLTGNSSLLDALTQIDSAIMKNYAAEYPTGATHNIEHNLDSDILHVTVKNRDTNQNIKDASYSVTYLDNNNIRINLSSSVPIKVLLSSV